MGRRRRTFTDRFKAQVAPEAVKGVKTLAALAAEYKVHPSQISTWRKQLGLRHSPEERRTSLTVRADAPLDHRLRLRLGPLPRGAREVRAERDGAGIPCEPVQSGDSVCVWMTVEPFDGARTGLTAAWVE